MSIDPHPYLPFSSLTSSVSVVQSTRVSSDATSHEQASPSAQPGRLGLLTSGADSPGLNAAIRAVVHQAQERGHQVFGLLNGWRGLLDGVARRVDETTVRDILSIGGTILGTSRGDGRDSEVTLMRDNLARLGLGGLVVIGDRDALSLAYRLALQDIPVVGVPETMDNDIAGTEYCIGFNSAVTTVVDALDKLHTTASAHHRVMVVEVMGRTTGWVALAGGCGSGAHCILVPEIPFEIGAVADLVVKRSNSGHGFSIVVVAEGVDVSAAGITVPPSSHDSHIGDPWQSTIRRRGPTPGELIGESIEQLTGLETRVTVLGHVQRGGSPTVYDRMMASHYGAAAASAACDGQWGTMVALRNNQVTMVDLAEATGAPRAADKSLLELARMLGSLSMQPARFQELTASP